MEPLLECLDQPRGCMLALSSPVSTACCPEQPSAGWERQSVDSARRLWCPGFCSLGRAAVGDPRAEDWVPGVGVRLPTLAGHLLCGPTGLEPLWVAHHWERTWLPRALPRPLPASLGVKQMSVMLGSQGSQGSQPHPRMRFFSEVSTAATGTRGVCR